MNKARTRRTKVELNVDIANAISDAVSNIGFAKLTLRDIMDIGHFAPPVIQSRYNSVEELIDQFVKRYDYWVNNTIDINPANIESPKDYYILAAEKLINSFYNNKELQQLHIWEMSENNPITTRTANNREKETVALVYFFKEFFKDTEMDISAVTAVLIGGIYDVILRKNRSSFCGVDFKKRAGKQRLIDAVTTLINLIYEKKDQIDNTTKIAMRLLKNGVSDEIIAESTGLSVEKIRQLKSM